jgi:hypothetical protein
MINIITYIEEQLNKLVEEQATLDAAASIDVGINIGKQQAYKDILCQLQNSRLIADAEGIYNILKNIRYSKNGTMQFSQPLSSEFTDYALQDISQKLYLGLRDANMLRANTPVLTYKALSESEKEDYIRQLAVVFSNIQFHPTEGTVMTANLLNQFSVTALREIFEQLIAHGVVPTNSNIEITNTEV